MNSLSDNITSRYGMVDYANASQEVKAIYEDTMQTLQLPFVLNWFKCQGSNAVLLRGNWIKLKSTLVEGEVPNVLKQLIIYNVSKTRGCEYCAHAHGIFANSMSSMISEEPGYKATDLDAPQLPNAYKAAINIISKAALHAQDISNTDFEELSACGFSPSEIQELMAQADLVNMLNTMADISGIKVDNELLEAQI